MRLTSAQTNVQSRTRRRRRRIPIWMKQSALGVLTLLLLIATVLFIVVSIDALLFRWFHSWDVQMEQWWLAYVLNPLAGIFPWTR
jgi:hypothetical protein